MNYQTSKIMERTVLKNNYSIGNQRNRFANENKYPLKVGINRFQFNNQNYGNEQEVQYEVLSPDEKFHMFKIMNMSTVKPTLCYKI